MGHSLEGNPRVRWDDEAPALSLASQEALQRSGVCARAGHRMGGGRTRLGVGFGRSRLRAFGPKLGGAVAYGTAPAGRWRREGGAGTAMVAAAAGGGLGGGIRSGRVSMSSESVDSLSETKGST